jgi:HD-like signal output (HDOD) protein/CheY-like chemotaxis protein
MRNRLLFVDDEPLVLGGLRRALRGLHGEWDMHFVESADAALKALDEQPYDAVITDMRMPRMDGAELLDLVKERHPNVIRLVLSGQASRASVLRAIAPAHQFLSKPCEPEELVARIAQALAMRDMLSSGPIKTAVSRLRTLPSMPAIYEEMTAALHAEDPSIAHIEAIISKDASMAAKILQLANSAFIGANSRISSMVHAISLIGLENIRTLVLSVHIFSQFDGNSGVDAFLPALWDHGLKVAKLAREIARAENCPKATLEESFTAGLLHDIGKIVFLAEMSKEYRPIALGTARGSIVVLELEHLGCTHAQVGAYLMSIWGLPVPLVRAVAFHHCPLDSAESHFSSLTAVHVADALATATDPAPVNHDNELDLNYLDRLGLRIRAEVWRGLNEAQTRATQQAGAGGS